MWLTPPLPKDLMGANSEMWKVSGDHMTRVTLRGLRHDQFSVPASTQNTVFVMSRLGH